MPATSEELIEMPGTPEQLKARWKTPDGKRRIDAIIKGAKRHEDWACLLKYFPHVEEVENGRDLREADLSKADLSEADLSEANLIEANLSEANLTKANLYRVDLTDANLVEADLTKANLIQADLCRPDLYHANLTEANLTKANLIGANLSKVGLYWANLTEANLTKADLTAANLIEANLSNADLSEANLTKANLTKANLTKADLRGSCMIGSVLYKATLTGAMLFGTARDDWEIQGVKCRYVYWDSEGKGRSPKDRDLTSREFECLYASLPTIEYVFQNGMTPMDLVILNRVVEAIQKERPDLDLRIASVDTRGPEPSVKLTVRIREQKATGLAMLDEKYKRKCAEFEATRDILSDLVNRLVDKPREIRNVTISPGGTHTEVSGTVIGDQMQIGVTGSQQVQIGADTREAIAALCKAVQDAVAKAVVSQAGKDMLRGQLEILKVETTSDQPKPTVLKACLYTMKTILVGAASGGVAHVVIQNIDKVARLLGITL